MEPDQPTKAVEQAELSAHWNEYHIDYGFAHAKFWTRTTDAAQVRAEFYACANECFGIRKCIMKYVVTKTTLDVVPPLLAERGATQQLAFLGDVYVFDRRHETPGRSGWKLHANGEDCRCQKAGTPELECELHHFDVADHDEECRTCPN